MSVCQTETEECSGQRKHHGQRPDMFESVDPLETCKSFCVTLALEEKKPERWAGLSS